MIDKKKFKKMQEAFVDSPLFVLLTIFDKYPRTIYKYRNWEDKFHKRILTHNEIFMSPPNLFNDPFDCRIYEDMSWLHDEEKKQKYIEKTLIKSKDHILKNYKSEEEARKIIAGNAAYPYYYQKKSQETQDEYTDKYIGIASFAENCDSILMWSHYANHHKGFSIGFDEKKMKMSGLFGLCESVTYTENMPSYYTDESKTKEIRKELNKSIEWEYEREYRAISLFFDDRNKNPKRTVNFKDSYIKEIVFGLLMSDEHKAQITEIAKQKNIPLFQMKKIPFKFKLIKMLVE
jgi:hypothetical protein